MLSECICYLQQSAKRYWQGTEEDGGKEDLKGQNEGKTEHVLLQKEIPARMEGAKKRREREQERGGNKFISGVSRQ